MIDMAESSNKKFRTCRELESFYSTDKCKCAHYREHFPECSCETECVSAHSPGVVMDDELVVRTIFHSDHIDAEGRLTPSSFRASMGNRGLSVDRLTYISTTDLLAKTSVSKNVQRFHCFATTRCGQIREPRDKESSRRLFAVYDTAMSENRAHAEICMNVYFEKGTPKRRDLNMKVVEILRDIFGVCSDSPPERE